MDFGAQNGKLSGYKVQINIAKKEKRMREIDINNLTGKNLIDHNGISEALKNYFIETLGYDDFIAEFVVSEDFQNPYTTPYIVQEYVDEAFVDGKEYEVRWCRTDFCMCGLYHLAELPPFEFYMFIDRETMPDDSVSSYMNARKMYMV